MRTVIVCGGRTYDDQETVERVLDELHAQDPITLLVHGGASGADTLAHHWAEKHRIKRKIYLPDWYLHGQAAGPIRNAQMLQEEKPDLVVAFLGGKGTANMTFQAKRANVPVIEITPESPRTLQESQSPANE